MGMSEHEPQSCAERHDDLAAYALGALPEAEAERLEAHLAGCDACSERLRWLQPAVDLVPATVPQYEAPPALKASLMETVRAEAGAEQRFPARAEETPGWRARLRRTLFGNGSLRPALAGLAVACLVVVGVGGYLLGGDEDTGSMTEYAALPTSPKVTAEGTVSIENGRAMLVVDSMADIPSDEVYQVWIQHDGEVSPSEIFVVDDTGHGSVAIPSVPANADRIMVTREPAGGSEEPRTAPVLMAEMS
jgi:anti-sigma-K factor RskA